MINILDIPPSMFAFLVRNNMIAEVGKDSVTVGNIIIKKKPKNKTK